MSTWIKNLITSTQVKELKKENEELKAKLDERQEAINKTNAYYKKKLHEMQRRKAAVYPL
jgi:hypothetical protein